MAKSVAATEFCRNFGEYQRRAQREPIEVRSHGKTTGYFVSADAYERFERVLAASRQTFLPSELPADLMAAIKESRMDAKHEALNTLLEDSN